MDNLAHAVTFNRIPPAGGRAILAARLLLTFSVAGVAVAQDVPTPESVIGHRVGADYKLARWAKIVEYFEKLDPASDRVRVTRVDTSTEGLPYLLVEISSEANMRDLDRYRGLQARLHDPRLIRSDDQRAEVLRDARSVVLVSCSLHSNEVAAAQMAMELACDLATGDDPRTREILDNCIILLVPSANPDGIDKIIDWYEKYLGTPYEGGPMPWLYQRYAGHDNNRDWYMLNLKETRILTRIMYSQWRPTIMYDVHQMGNRGARFFVPPFFDPVNPNVDPLIHQSLVIIGGHMATELQEHGKSGVVYNAIFDNWWAGGNRTTPYRHNIVGILTEAASANVASPVFQPHRDLGGGGRGFPDYEPAVNFPDPWPGGWWRLRDIVEYELIACKSLFTLAARYRDHFVGNHLALSEKALSVGKSEPPYAWLVPPDQRDAASAARMLEILHASGIEIHRADEPFKADGVPYPAGTHVLLASQPYRPHLKDMMERQEYPDRRAYPGGPAESPYDVAGWTLPLQMGVRSVAVDAPFDAKLTLLDRIDHPVLKLPPAEGASAWATNRASTDDYRAVNRTLKAGATASVLTEAVDDLPVGSIVFNGSSSAGVGLAEAGFQNLSPLSKAPDAGKLRTLRRPRVGLYQPWTASMDEGWTRLVLETFEFDYTTLHNAEIRAGGLADRYDCIIIPDLSLRSILDGIADTRMPPPYAGGIGDEGAMALERFVRAGGTLVLMDSATALATELYRLPIRDVLAGVGRERFFCPGSILRLRVDPAHPLGYGFADESVAYFAGSRAFETGLSALKSAAGAASREGAGGDPKKGGMADSGPSEAMLKERADAFPVTTAATYSDNVVLLSGWILGEDLLRGRSAVCEVKMGDGRIVCLGFRVQHRGQPHGTFRFLFNAIYLAGWESGSQRVRE
ncbi:MAG: peptidase M14 [Phycisphaerales bacterium]|nr:MAG: peptidase M14 [Phycisphaerales bacterium]